MFHRQPRRPSLLAQLPIVEYEEAVEDNPQIRATFKEHENENSRFEKYLAVLSSQAKAAAQAGTTYVHSPHTPLPGAIVAQWPSYILQWRSD